ncbi:MAG: ATPase V [Spirochaetes bacterium]|nr:ATPase V [Spirochaetota bacterium]
MTEIYVIAEEELVIAFRMIGLEGVAVSGREEAVAAFRAAVDPSSGCKMLILSEEIGDALGAELVQWQLSGNYPLVVDIPPLSGSPAGHKSLVDAVRQAIGIKIQ